MRERRKALSLFLVFALLLNLFLPMSLVGAEDNGNDPENGEDCTATTTTDVYGNVIETEPCEEGQSSGFPIVTFSSPIITENILTSAQITIKDESNQTLPEADSTSIIQVEYSWKLDNNHGYGDGATYTFDLPEELKVYNVVSNEPLIFNGEEIGTFSVDMDGKVTIVFNNFIS